MSSTNRNNSVEFGHEIKNGSNSIKSLGIFLLDPSTVHFKRMRELRTKLELEHEKQFDMQQNQTRK